MKKIFILLGFLGILFSGLAQGDICDNALDLGTLPAPNPCDGSGNEGNGTTVNGAYTNVGAIGENPYSSILDCAGSGGDMASPAADVWFSFVASGNELDLGITSGLGGVSVGIYSGLNCNTMTPIFCANSNSGNLTETFTPLSPGTTYFIQVSGEDEADQSAFNLSLNNYMNCDLCATDQSLVADPAPVSGVYEAGTTIEYCYTIENFTQVSSNWLHGVSPTNIGNGFDASTLTPVSITGGNDANWIWTNNNVPDWGWYYDTDGNGDPSNNYGDINTGPWTFCWSIETVDNAVCNENVSVSFDIETYGDGETGNWTSVACTGDAVTPTIAALSCCDFPTIGSNPALCAGASDGSATAQGQGGAAPYDYIWENSANVVLFTDNNNNGVSTLSNVPAGTYTVIVTDDDGCQKIMDVTVDDGPDCCSINGFTSSTNLPNCSDVYSTTGTVTFNTALTTGQLIVRDCNGNEDVMNPPFVSPFNYSITSQAADGLPCEFTAWFTDDSTSCSIESPYVAQLSTGANEAGTFNPGHNGDGTNTPEPATINYILCDQDQFTFSNNNDFVIPDISAGTPDPTDGYNPGIVYMIYDCPPSPGGVGINPFTDPCWVGYINAGDDIVITNNAGTPSSGGTLDANQGYYIVPISSYDVTGPFFHADCYDLSIGDTYYVQYLNPITFTFTEDCQAGTATITLNGGYPEFYPGEEFTGSNLSHGSFTDNTAEHGQTITISGLAAGDNYSFDVVDQNGCPITINPAGTFPPILDAAFGYIEDTYCTTGVDPNPTGVTNPGGTFYSIQAGLSINAGNGTIDLSNSADGVYDIVYTTQPLDAVCFDTDTFQVTINATPVVTDVADDEFCDLYTLPLSTDVDNTNNTANLGLFTAPNGGGTQLTFGADLTTPGANTIYIYDETGTNPNCSDQEQFVITIYETPVVDDVSDDIVCDTYPLPTLADVDNANNTANMGLFTAPNGGGTQLGFGANFTTAGATTIYIYDETGTNPNCFDQEQFSITINQSVDAGADDVATLCNAAGNQLTLSTMLSGADAGGVWSETTGLPHGEPGTASGQFNAGTSIFDPNALSAGTYSFMYLLTATAPCVNDTAFFNITVTGLIDAGADHNDEFCNTPGSNVDLNTMLDAGVSGGTWSQVGGAATPQFNAATGVLDMSNLVADSYVFRYTIPASGPCLGDDADMTITINEIPYINNPLDSTRCDSYTLPAISGTALTAGVGYYTAPSGGGANLAVSSNITAAGVTTVYVYDETGTTPNCFDEDTFDITINLTPIIDDPVNVTVCDSFQLAAITGTNLVGATYSDAVGGLGIVSNPGDWISSTTTIHLYDETGTTPNCSDQENFIITVNNTPDITPYNDTTVCDTYSIPAITGSNLSGSQSFYNATNGGGGAIAQSTNITSTQTVFMYDETGTNPNCFDEQSYTITVNNSVFAGLDNGQQVCNIGGSNINLSTDLLDPTADAGGVWSETTGQPHGVPGAPSGQFNTATTVLNTGGLAAGTYSFMYLLTTTTPCVNDTAFFTINVTGLIDAGSDNNDEFCNTPGGTVDLNDLLDAGVTGGAWTETTGVPSGQFTNASGVLNMSNLSSGDYTFNYSIPANGSCPGDDADMTITINEVPYIDNLSDVERCDTYTLPAITGASLVGANYHTQPQAAGGGVVLNAGDAITTTQTIYMYDETGTTPNCFDQDTFEVVINLTPTITAVLDTTVCDSYTLLGINGGNLTGNESYYTATNGGGTQLNVGDALTTSQQVYIYDETGTAPNCFNEQVFQLTVNTTPTVDDILDQEHCDSYTLPNITGTNTTVNSAFYTGPGGTGTQYNPGDVITASDQLYIYDETATDPNCTDEEDFQITINVTPTVDVLTDQEHCDDYTLPAITGTNLTGNEGYFTAPDGGGVELNVGQVLTSSQVVYIYDETATSPNCDHETNFQLTINLTPDVDDQLDNDYCNDMTLPAITGTNITPSAAYYSQPNGTGVQYNAGDVITTSMLPLYIYNETGTNPNCFDEEEVNITIDNSISAGADNSTEICAEGGLVDVGALLDPLADTDGNAADDWSETTASGQFNTGTQIFDVTGLAAGDYTFQYEIQGAGACATDDALFTVTINPLPIVDAGNFYTICGGSQAILTGAVEVASPVNFGQMVSFNWDNGVVNGQAFTPVQTQLYTVTGEDNNGCIDTDTVTVTIETAPQMIFSADVVNGCSPLQVTLTNNSTPVGTNCVWTLSNGTVLNGCGNVSTTLVDAGCYDVTLEMTSSNQCSYDVTYSDYLCVGEDPIAAFTDEPGGYTVTNPEVNFINNSSNATSYEWSFGDDGTSTQEHPTHIYSNLTPETYDVELVAHSSVGCTDTAYATIEILDELLYHIPNTFTPDQDDFNETFQPVFISGFDPYNYTLLIFDRWGEILFESHDASVGWDGRYGGKLVQDGTYLWKIDFKETMSDKRHSIAGHVNVLK